MHRKYHMHWIQTSRPIRKYGTASKADPLFIGGIAASPYEMGKTLADQAIEAGDKTALFLGSNR